MNIFRRKHRQTKIFFANTIAGLLVGTISGVLFSLILNPTFKLETNLIKLTVYFTLFLIVLILFYVLGRWQAPDLKAKITFHEAYWTGGVTTLAAGLLIIFNDWIRQSICTWLITLGILGSVEK